MSVVPKLKTFALAAVWMLDCDGGGMKEERVRLGCYSIQVTGDSALDHGCNGGNNEKCHDPLCVLEMMSQGWSPGFWL